MLSLWVGATGVEVGSGAMVAVGVGDGGKAVEVGVADGMDVAVGANKVGIGVAVTEAITAPGLRVVASGRLEEVA